MSEKLEEKIIYKTLDTESFPLFILYFLYLEHREKSIPKELFSPLSKELKDVAYNEKWLDEFFERYISEIKDINVLEKIEKKIIHFLTRYEHKAQNRIEIHWLKLLKILDNHITELVSEEHSKNIKSETITQTENIINWNLNEAETTESVENTASNEIRLKDSLFDYDKWSLIYEKIIWNFDKLLLIPEIKKYKTIEKFRDSFKEKSKKDIHVFMTAELFLKHFKIPDFYRYLISIIENNSDFQDITKKEFKKFIPIFTGEYRNSTEFNEIQNKLQNML